MEHELSGTTPMQKCNDLYTLLGAVKGRDYKCPNCGKSHDDDDGQYKVGNEEYSKWFNESRCATVDDSYWDWDEVHCCENRVTIYWFRSGAY